MTREIMEINAQEGTEVVRTMTNYELEALEKQNSDYLAQKQSEALAKEEAISALLASTGLTREQAELLGLVEKPFVPKVEKLIEVVSSE